jgi:TPR repeat protein/TolB-like protein
MRRPPLAALLAPLVLAATLAAAAGPQGPKVVAVLELQNRLKAADREAIDVTYVADRVRGAVLELLPDKVRVMTRENMLVLLGATGKTLADCEGECEVDTGRRLGADFAVAGEVLRFGSNLKVNLRLYETQDGSLLASMQASGKDADALDQAMGPSVEKLLSPVRGRLGLKPPPPAAGPLVVEPAPQPMAQALVPVSPVKVVPTAKGLSLAELRKVVTPKCSSAAECTDLGYSIEMGQKGMKQDLSQASALYLRSCELGNGIGCTNFGYMLEHGRGTATDYESSLRYYQRGCELGTPRGCNGAGALTENGKGTREDKVKARAWYEKACVPDYPKGCSNLGFMTEHGIGGPADLPRARKLYQEACDKRGGDGCLGLGNMVETGRGGSMDKAEARRLFARACELGRKDACGK